MTSFWNIWIILPTVLTFVGITWILFANRKTSEKKTTGHEYDGIEEYDNPLPAWWLYLFVLTIVFGAVYLLLYPGLGSYKGLLNWSSEGQWQAEVDAAEAKYNEMFAKFRSTAVEDLAQDKKALKMGRRLFANNCAQCHGADAKGAYGIPNLTDSEWLYGASAEAIKTSIAQGRSAMMPAWGSVLKVEQVTELANTIVKTQNLSSKAEKVKLLSGHETYQTYCASCHGKDGIGMQTVGAPSLIDDVWLYGKTPEMVEQSIFDGRAGKMPAHSELISEDKIHLITAYVYSFKLKANASANTNTKVLAETLAAKL